MDGPLGDRPARCLQRKTTSRPCCNSPWSAAGDPLPQVRRRGQQLASLRHQPRQQVLLMRTGTPRTARGWAMATVGRRPDGAIAPGPLWHQACCAPTRSATSRRTSSWRCRDQPDRELTTTVTRRPRLRPSSGRPSNSVDGRSRWLRLAGVEPAARDRSRHETARGPHGRHPCRSLTSAAACTPTTLPTATRCGLRPRRCRGNSGVKAAGSDGRKRLADLGASPPSPDGGDEPVCSLELVEPGQDVSRRCATTSGTDPCRRRGTRSRGHGSRPADRRC
jgi:hypothetical protein